MWRQTIKIFLITLLAVLVVGGAAIYYFKHRHRPEIRATVPPPITEVSPDPQVSSSPEVRSDAEAPPTATLPDQTPFAVEMRKRFIQEGWTPAAADHFLKLNGGWFALLHREDGLAYTKQLTLLAALGSEPRLMPFLEKHPESAGLFAVAKKPTLRLRLFESAGGDYDFLVNLYVVHAAPLDAELLTDALLNNGDLITRLYRRGLVGSEAIFFFDRTDESGFEYDQWLREILTVKLDKTDAELASLLNMVLKYGPEIRSRLRDEESFRLAFRTTIWPKLVRVAAANHNLFDLYLADPRIWDLLARPEGEELLRLRGPLPIDLLYGYPELSRAPYPADLHETVVQALLQGDEQTIRALMKFRAEPSFHALARRTVPAAVKTAAFKKLFEAGTDYPDLLRRYSVMSDQGLQEEVGPPPNLLQTWMPFYYTLWEVPNKLRQGRNPTSSDWFNSLADPVSFLYPILKIGVAFVNVRKTVLDLAHDGKIAPELKKTSMQMAGQQLGAELAAKLSDQELIPFGVTGMLTRMQETYREKVSPTTVVDSTGPVRFMLGYSSTSHSSLETLNLIDGHILQRGDGRLLIQPGQDSPDQAAHRYLAAAAQGFVAASGGVHPPGHDDLSAWRQNVSSWWLMQASGMLRRSSSARIPALKSATGGR
jgi:hypothetical protein